MGRVDQFNLKVPCYCSKQRTHGGTEAMDHAGNRFYGKVSGSLRFEMWRPPGKLSERITLIISQAGNLSFLGRTARVYVTVPDRVIDRCMIGKMVQWNDVYHIRLQFLQKDLKT